jgi:beta-glucosidase
MKKQTLILMNLLAFVFVQAQQLDMEKIEQKVDKLISKMTLEEKASLCSGKDNWSFKPINRLDIPSIWVADGPHGLRKAPSSDAPGFGDQHPATCFPTASALAATWDLDLIQDVGKHIAIECQALNVHVLLGPGVNIKRSPLGGRNFEYFSEDPFLAGELAAAFINGVQNEGVGTSLKHYACNSQETQRMLVNSIVDERTMREIYLRNFEIAIKKSQPWTVMAAYNPVNGIHATENRYLLKDILKEEWGFEGIVISDWISVYDRVAGVMAGMHVEMPGSQGVNDAKIVEAVKRGDLAESELDALIKETLLITFKAKALEKEGVSYKIDEHHLLARKVAGEATTLLKNENDILPISKQKYNNVAIIGEFAVAPRYQGNGSSEIKPTRTDTALTEIKAIAGTDYNITFAQGYKLDSDDDLSLFDEAIAVAKESDVAVVFAGLPQHYESEGYDRKHIDMPPAHNKLIEAIAKVQKNVVVVLTNGTAVSMPWINEVPSVLETWLAGQAGAGGITDALFGKVTPSGKLAETFPVKLEDTPSFLSFPGKNRSVIYGEEIFVGYRWYDTREIEPLFPFGHGLSYTTFDYSDLSLSKSGISGDEELIVQLKVKNIGDKFGKEVVQLYLTDKESKLKRPTKELKGFKKIALQPGEQKEVSFTLTMEDLSYFDPGYKKWIAESGKFKVLIGSSSRDIRLKEEFDYASQQMVFTAFDVNTTIREWISYPETRKLVSEVVLPAFKLMMNTGDTPIEEIEMGDYFLDMPLIKYHYISGGLVKTEDIERIVKEARMIKINL